MNKAMEIFRKHTMKIVLVLIVIFFSVMTEGQMFAASSFPGVDRAERLCVRVGDRYVNVYADRR